MLKAVDDMRRPGIVAEVFGCRCLAELGKHVMRLPENIADLIDDVVIECKPYRSLLKYKVSAEKPKGYPDVYFDGQTWDFKAPAYQNVESVRQIIKDGRKADNIIFIGAERSDVKLIKVAIDREFGRKKNDETWRELPNLYCICQGDLEAIWIKEKEGD